MICPHCSTELPEAYARDWHTMSVETQLRALAAAPSVAGPWYETPAGWVRDRLYPFATYHPRCARVWESSVPCEWIGKARKAMVGIYPGAAAARDGVDEALRLLGWRVS